MKKWSKFFISMSLLFLLMGIITFIEINRFSLFEKIFTFIKTPSAWFIGISLAYPLSSIVQRSLFSVFSKRFSDEKIRAESFELFLIVILTTAVITPYIKQAATYFFTQFFIYFHVILLQSTIIVYLFFKIRGNFEISGKYFFVSEIIALINTAIILYFVT